MGKIRDVLMREAKAMEDNSELAGKKPVNVMVIMQFEDNHVHSQIPPHPAVFTSMMDHLLEQLAKVKQDKKSPLIWLDGV